MAKLTIHFGGLCLFVQRKNGLCVLMARDYVHGHGPQVSSDLTSWKKLKRDSYDLTPKLRGGNGRVAFKEALHFTALMGGRVPTATFGSTMPSSVIARFFLPFPLADAAPYCTVEVNEVGKATSFPVTGVMKLTFEVTQDFTIGGIAVKAATGGDIGIANFIPGSSHQAHGAKTPLAHANHHLALVEPLPDELPQYEVTTGYTPCAEFVDPVMCTVGTACEEGDVTCDDTFTALRQR